MSSTLEELEAERTVAREAIARLRLTPVLFEMGARPHRPRDLYHAYIDQSHVFIGIYWESYGWVAPSAEVSGLEEEYRAAVSLPRLIYIKKPAPHRDARLEGLIQEITRDGSLCYRLFSTPDELREFIENDLAVLLTERFHAPRQSVVHPEGVGTELPAGTITLVFTDIEGSTRLLQTLGDDYHRVLADHHRLIRTAARTCEGHEISTAGDVFFVVFRRPAAALSFAVEVQRALARQPWPAGAPPRVRVGMHTGEPALVGDQYVGLCVHTAARIASAAHGGQILLSSTTRDLVERDLPGGITLQDLGVHRLKDLDQGQHLFQVLHADLAADFPPLQSQDTLPTNLPRKLTSFVGRGRELTILKEFVATTPLVTIVGIGGAGKTRLALETAAGLLDTFRDGVWLVELAAASDPRQIPYAVATALGVREYPGLSLRASVLDYLRTREILLLIDNCEHQITAVAEFVEELLRGAPLVKVLCTSREPLGIDGEKVWRIPPLTLPDARQPATPETLAQNEAVRLFVERATAVSPLFALTGENAKLVSNICACLDGIPLAIELAAARVKVLTVHQIAQRLDDRFRLLTGGSRTAMPRHRTLRAAMDWSYDLVSEEERALLRRLSVFAGGWTLDAAEAVCSGGILGRDILLDVLVHVVDKSLVVSGGETQARYTMLETIRQYAHEKLLAAGEAIDTRSRHRGWFLALAEEAEPHLRGPQQKTWLDRLEREWDNLHVALRSAVESDDADCALRLAASLWRFWYLRGHLRSGEELLATVLRRVGAPTAARARTLNGAAVLAIATGNYAQALEYAHQTMGLALTFGDTCTAASARLVIGAAHLARGDCTRAVAVVEEALAEFRACEDRWGEALALSVFGDVAIDRGEYERALRLYEESVEGFRRVGDAWGVALSERGRGFAARLLGDYDQAVSVQTASLALARQLGDRTGMGSSMVQLGFLHWRQGEYARARSVLDEALAMFREAGNRRGMADALSVLGLVEEYQGNHERASEVLEESVELYRAIGARFGVASVLGTLGRVALHEGDEARAVALAEEAVSVFREIGDRYGVATSLRVLGEAALDRKDYDQAMRYAQESHAAFVDLGNRWAIGYALRLLAGISLAQGDLDGARRRYVESLSLHVEHRDRLGIVKCLEGLARVLVDDGQFEQAARLLGTADQARATIGARRTSLEVPSYEQCVTRLREVLGGLRCEGLMNDGRGQREESWLAQIDLSRSTAG